MVSPVRLCGQCGQIPCVVFTACVVWWPLGCVYTTVTCSCCGPALHMCCSVVRLLQVIAPPTSLRGPSTAPRKPKPGAKFARVAGCVRRHGSLHGRGWAYSGLGLSCRWSLSPFAHGAPCLPLPPWQPTNFILMDVAAPSPDARTICRLVCALLPAITFPAFLQFACVLLG